MNIREALITQAPSLTLQRAAADEIARLDAKIETYRIDAVEVARLRAENLELIRANATVADLNMEMYRFMDTGAFNAWASDPESKAYQAAIAKMREQTEVQV